MIKYKGKCYICSARKSLFCIDDKATLFREARCNICCSSLRNNAIAMAICKLYNIESLSSETDKLANLSVYELSSTGSINIKMKSLCNNYYCSEFFDDIKPGRYYEGIRCENIMCLTFKDEMFDLVIAEDVLEHVEDYQTAFLEIRRVLKKGGRFVFTIPYHEKSVTVVRTKVFPQFPVFHGDPIREKIIVHNDFGDDIVKWLDLIGMETKVIYLNKWYRPKHITKIYSYKEYEEYLKAVDLLQFFKYNNMVFVSRKKVV